MPPPPSTFSPTRAAPRRGATLLIDALEGRRLLSAAPSISLPSSVTVPAGKTIQVPISGDASSSLDYEADPSSGLTASFHASNPWLELDTDRGTLRFQLFADLAPNTVRKIRGLVDSGFYDGLKFFRVRNNAGDRIAQSGSPDDTKTGRPGFLFDDEFNRDAIFDYTGQLAMANAGKDANGSQFFVTGAQARYDDFNHTIFGQLTRGSKVLESILATADPNADSSTAAPLESTTIERARIVTGVRDAVLQVRAGSKTGTRSVTVTAVDDDGREVTQTLRVKVVAETNNTPPILDAPQSPILASAGDTVTIPVRAIDLEGEAYEIRAVIERGGAGVASSYYEADDHVVVINVADDFRGAIGIKVGVKALQATSRGAIPTAPGDDVNDLKIYDTQSLTISVGGAPIERTASVGTIGAHVGEQIGDDTVLATFDSDDDSGADDFAATVDWGDGAPLADATIQRVKRGTFAVVGGGHAYARAADAVPVEVAIRGKNGTNATVYATAAIAAPATLDDDGTLTIRGTAGDDEVELKRDDDTLEIRVRGDGDDSKSTFDASKIKRIVVALYGGDDELRTVDADGLPAMTIDSGAGDDTVYGGGGDDAIDGGDGDDALYGNEGNDTIHGGAGDDSVLTGAGKNVVYAEDGDDRVVGSNGRDYLNGGDGTDRLYGRGGDDTIEGGGGTDRLYGEDGDDRLIGGSSNDRLYGGDGDDTLYGNAGSDGLYGGPGANVRGDDDENDAVSDLDL